MRPTETVLLCRLVRAACPQQAMDDATPDIWHRLLDGIRFVDAEAALIAIARRQPFASPAEIIAEVRRIRDQRIASHGPPEPPPGLADDEVSYRRWLVQARRDIADGRTAVEAIELPARDMRTIEGTFQEVPDA